MLNPDSAVMEEDMLNMVCWLLEKVPNRDINDSENVTGNETMLMREIIDMVIKIDLLLESGN